MEEDGRRLVARWTSILSLLMALDRKWGEFRQGVLESPRGLIESLPLEVQKAVSKWGRMEFRKAAPDFIPHLWATGGFKQHLKAVKEE